MTTHDIERQLAALFEEEAEDAMTETDTQGQLSKLLAEADARSRRRRWIGWAGTSALVAAAAVVTVIVLRPGAERAEAPPAGEDETSTAAEQVALDFMEAYAAFDRERLTSLMAADATVTGVQQPFVAGLLVSNRWDEAGGAQTVSVTCEETSTSGATRVGCLRTYHFVYSDELGRGPFDGNRFEFSIQAGEVAVLNVVWNDAASGFVEQIQEPFVAWLQVEHEPTELSVMSRVDDPGATQEEIDTAVELFAVRAREYADAVLAGEAE